MKTHLVEATNGPQNWGKFLIGHFTDEWRHESLVSPGHLLLSSRGWRTNHYLVLDLQTGEGAVFNIEPHAHASADLKRHAIWVCPLFEPFLTWLYQQPDPMAVPHLVDLPDAPFSFAGYRRPGPEAT